MIPHQLNEDFDRVLIVHFICCLKIKQSDKLYRVVPCEDPVKVESLYLDLTERIFHVIFFKAKVVLFNQFISFFDFKLFFLLEKIIQPSAIIVWPIFDLVFEYLARDEGSLACKHNLFTVFWPLNHKWCLQERWVELRLVKILEHLTKAWDNHVLKVTEHHLWTTDIVKVFEHSYHHLEIVWLLLVDS